MKNKGIHVTHSDDRSRKATRVVWDGKGSAPRHTPSKIETDCWWDDDDEIRQSRKDSIYSHHLRRR